MRRPLTDAETLAAALAALHPALSLCDAFDIATHKRDTLLA
jgi:hypothetical protein